MGAVLTAWLVFALQGVIGAVLPEPPVNQPAGERAPAPRPLSFEPIDPENVGTVAPGVLVTRRVVIRNISSSRLKVDIGAKSCGCVAATIVEPVLAPGKTTLLTFGPMATQAEGLQSYSVEVRAWAVDDNGQVGRQAGSDVLRVSYVPDVAFLVRPMTVGLRAPRGAVPVAHVVVRGVDGLRAPDTTVTVAPKGSPVIERAAVVTERSADATVLNLSVELPIAEDSDVGVIELHPASRDRPVRVPYSVTRTNRLTWAAEPLAVAIPGGAGAVLLKEEPVTDSSGLVTPLASLSVMLDGPAKGITSELQPLGGGQWRVTARANGSPASAPSGAGWLTIQNQAGVTLARLPWTWVPSAR